MPSRVSHLEVHPGGEPGTGDASALEPLSEAIEAGSGLPELVRAAARALNASLVLIDRAKAVLAVAARSPAEEQALIAAGRGIETVELRLADEVVGQLRVRARGDDPPPSPLVRVAATLIAQEVERLRGPDRAAKAAAEAFLHRVMAREITDREELIAAGRELGLELSKGATILVARAHPVAPVDEDWRVRLLAVAERGARATVPGTVATPADSGDGPAGEVFLLVPEPDEDAARRAAEVVLRELEANLHGFTFAVGFSRVVSDPLALHRGGDEAVLAANVAETSRGDGVLSFEDTGAYRLLLREDPAELQRFYAETLEPVVAYDEQYETDLVRTLETYLDADGNVAGTAQKLFTHRHTIRYRLERVRELSGLDVGSSDGREKLSLGLKAMRVLGIPSPRGPATEHGAEAGRVPREAKDRP